MDRGLPPLFEILLTRDPETLGIEIFIDPGFLVRIDIAELAAETDLDPRVFACVMLLRVPQDALPRRCWRVSGILAPPELGSYTHMYGMNGLFAVNLIKHYAAAPLR